MLKHNGKIPHNFKASIRCRGVVSLILLLYIWEKKPLDAMDSRLDGLLGSSRHDGTK
jgi:hypothetical protein